MGGNPKGGQLPHCYLHRRSLGEGVRPPAEESMCQWHMLSTMRLRSRLGRREFTPYQTIF